ncbi:acyl-CoA dehydrogenase family protein [Nocardioides sp. P86]|uniref:acyl-CoA dehydrogenase family protein n=1 Tax=Nocardioides sp. P86 TaxID=2939569 RepID=UPI00203A4F98|nr:acyl-CoA dehydrogenase family protein [Nocardioides sp. P86]MCM3514637.1 acyl-CoA dehydrogenase family protein [Nocardioides sp. P86]
MSVQPSVQPAARSSVGRAPARQAAVPFVPHVAVDSPRLAGLRATYAPLWERIAAGAVGRELDGELPVEQVAWLKAAGFGAVRVPREHGGEGLSLPEVTQLWIELAAVDSNLPQAFRGHFALVEDRLWQHARGSDQARWFDRFAAGEIAGNAWSEVGATEIGTQRTVLTRLAGGDYRLDGTKYYTTGTIYAEWVDVYALRDEGDEGEGGAGVGGADDFAIAIVDTRRSGVSVVDDWDGFGQRGTGSGTTSFDAVRVPAEDVLAFEERFPHQTALYQLNLLATLAGIGRAALADAVTEVRRRERNYSHANAARVRDDAQVLARIGEIAAAVYAAEAATLRVAEALQAVADSAHGDPERTRRLVEVGEIESSTAQVVVTDLVLRATNDLFDTLGASATARGRALDRHWRNARTVSSHNPRILKARVVGDHLVNGATPPYAWSIGATRRDR